MLAKIFKPEADLVTEICPIEFGEVVKAARDCGLDYIPTIHQIALSHTHTGIYKMTPGYPQKPRIEVTKKYDHCQFGGDVADRPMSLQQRTLAHELGHVYAIKHNDDFSEAAADEFRNRILAQMG